MGSGSAHHRLRSLTVGGLVLALVAGVGPVRESSDGLDLARLVVGPQAARAEEAPPPEREELVERRNAWMKHFREPDGSYTAEVFATPVHFRDDSGDWAEIDPSLMASDREGYAWAMGAGPVAIEFAANARSKDTLLIAAGNQTFTLGPVGTGASDAVVDGSEITYPGVWPEADGAGHLVRSVSAQGIATYAWTGNDELAQVTLPDSTTISFTYDASGARITKTVSGTTTTYAYERGRLVSETTPGVGTTSFTYDSDGRPLTITLPSGDTYAFRFDGRGSVIRLTDNAHNTAASYTYDAWGNIAASDGDADLLELNTFTYRGAFGIRQDGETGLYLMQARYYDPAGGRFISPDPITADPTESRYVYAANNPVTNLDPTGLYPCWGDPCTRHPCWKGKWDQQCLEEESKSNQKSSKNSGNPRPPARHKAIRTHPVPKAIKNSITNSYNFRCPYNNCNTYGPYARGKHAAIDLGGGMRGAKVVSTCRGTAMRRPGNWRGWGSAYGNQILVKCKGDGSWGTFYAHLSEFAISKKGQSVKWGQKIGEVGGSGHRGAYTFAAHLHFELHKPWSDWKATRNPYKWLRNLQKRYAMGYRP